VRVNKTASVMNIAIHRYSLICALVLTEKLSKRIGLIGLIPPMTPWDRAKILDERQRPENEINWRSEVFADDPNSEENSAPNSRFAMTMGHSGVLRPSCHLLTIERDREWQKPVGIAKPIEMGGAMDK
jgi:hypothetical protein